MVIHVTDCRIGTLGFPVGEPRLSVLERGRTGMGSLLGLSCGVCEQP